MAGAAKAVAIAHGVTRLTAPNPGPMTGAGTNSYFVGEDRLALIDPGPDLDAHVDALVAYADGRLDAILVTHTHRDHSPAAAAVAARTGAAVYGMLPPATLENDAAFAPDTVLEHEHSVTVGGHEIVAIHTPGHASNHVCFLHKATGILFTGDHIMNGSTVVIAAPDGNMRAYLDSLALLKHYAPQTIAPGHGEPLLEPERAIDWIIAHRLEREAKVVEKLAALAPATIDALLPQVYDEVEPALWPIARYSLRAHLEKLLEEGRAQCTETEWTLVAD
ncbi:MAG: MBL fold metallo-hydrolase [Pseudomonadota bacterium]